MIDSWDIDNVSDHREHIGFSNLKNYGYRFADLSSIFVCVVVPYLVHISISVVFLSQHIPSKWKGIFENANFSWKQTIESLSN